MNGRPIRNHPHPKGGNMGESVAANHRKTSILGVARGALGSIERYLKRELTDEKDGFDWVQIRDGGAIHVSKDEPEGLIRNATAADFEGIPVDQFRKD